MMLARCRQTNPTTLCRRMQLAYPIARHQLARRQGRQAVVGAAHARAAMAGQRRQRQPASAA